MRLQASRSDLLTRTNNFFPQFAETAGSAGHRRSIFSFSGAYKRPFAGFPFTANTVNPRRGLRRAVEATLAEPSERFPPGLTYLAQYDSTTFVSDTITEVLKTLGEALVPVHGHVPPRLIIVASVRSENPAKMCFA
jgi:Cu/Ag efflux pump CusA